LTFDVLTSKWGHRSPVSWFPSCQFSARLRVRHGTDRQTDGQPTSLHNAPTILRAGHGFTLSFERQNKHQNINQRRKINLERLYTFYFLLKTNEKYFIQTVSRCMQGTQKVTKYCTSFTPALLLSRFYLQLAAI